MFSFWRHWLQRAAAKRGSVRMIDRKQRRDRCAPARSLSFEWLENRVLLDSGGAAGFLSGAANQLVYTPNGGNTMIPNVNIDLIFLKDSSTTLELSAAQQVYFHNFFATIVSDGYIPSLLDEYDHTSPNYTPGNGTIGVDDINVPVTPDSTVGTVPAITDLNIQTVLENEIYLGHTVTGNLSQLYVIFPPPGDMVINHLNANSSTFTGYAYAFPGWSGFGNNYGRSHSRLKSTWRVPVTRHESVRHGEEEGQDWEGAHVLSGSKRGPDRSPK